MSIIIRTTLKLLFRNKGFWFFLLIAPALSVLIYSLNMDSLSMYLEHDNNKIIEIEDDKQDQNTKSAAYEFITAEGNDRFDVPEGQTELILGREGFLSGYLSGKMYVSRQQAAIVLQEDHFLIRNLSRTNPTFVENRELENGKEYSFPLGKEIGLGGKVINGTRQSQAAYLILREKT